MAQDYPTDPDRFFAREVAPPARKGTAKTLHEQAHQSPADLRRWAGQAYRAGITSGTDRMWDSRDDG